MPASAPVVLIACDKFKGTLSAAEACAAVAQGVLELWPRAECLLRPMADGGEGTSLVICEALGGEWHTAKVSGPRGEEVLAGFAMLPGSKTAVIEMSEASGLKLVPAAHRNPWRLNTAGTGQLMKKAMELGAEHLVVAIGGSATNDGGSGMAWALGYQFLNEAGEAIEPCPANLLEVARIVRPEGLNLPQVTAACDVTNPLLGKEGATAVYGPQKGVTLERLPQYEAGLEHLADLVKKELGVDFRTEPGAGAAGGLGFGLMSFCKAATRPGFDLVAEVTGLEHAVRQADLVITGEGCLDAQTMHGKGPARVAEMSRRLGKPVAAVGGMVEAGAEVALRARFHAVIGACTEETLAYALAHPAKAVAEAISGNRPVFESIMA
ncbi:MAG: glycerate kinase [Verrucomicrobiales bacterium]|nr:glycerate kinase [Verrucomicrobiales bacterium]